MMTLFSSMQGRDTSQIAVIVGATVMATLSLLAIKYPDRALFHERRKGLPLIKGHPIVGMLFKDIMNKDVMYEVMTNQFERADALTLEASTLGFPTAIYTIDPRNVEHLLKTNFSNYVKGTIFKHSMGDLFGYGIFVADGEHWRYQRKAASHIFNVLNFRTHFTEVFVDEIHTACDKVLSPKAESGDVVDFHDLMYKFTLESFVLLGFGVHLNAFDYEGKVPFAESFDVCQVNCFDRSINPFNPLQELLSPLLHPKTKTIRQHLQTVNSFAYSIIKERREQLAMGHSYKDLLSRFMSAKNEKNEPWNDKELRDMILNLIIAGRDTTAQALSWGFYCLMLHPRVEAKLYEEILLKTKDLDEKDPEAVYEVIKSMTYAHAVLFEVLRLNPSVPSNIREAVEDDVFPDGTVIHKGDWIIWSSYCQGQSTKLWGLDAKDFRPERWITPTGELRRESQGQYSVFHAGPRVCLGQNLAILEAILAMVMLLKRYKFTMAPNQHITYEASLTFPMKHGLQLYVEKRKQ